MSYYECKRCNLKTKYKKDILRHLNRTLKCPKNSKAYKYSNEELYNMSLERIICENNNSYDKDKLLCIHCNKYFSRNDNLNSHIKKFHNNEFQNNESNNNITSKDINTINNINGDNNNINNNITNINITNNNITNINYIILQPFDDDWKLEHINNSNKIAIVVSLMKYTTLLEKILENDENLNVILGDDSDNGLVYKNEKEKYVNMKNKDIYKLTMEKINKQLSDLYNEVNNETNVSKIIKTAILSDKEIMDKKYYEYSEKNDIQKKVNENLKEFFDKRKEDAVKILNTIEEIGY